MAPFDVAMLAITGLIAGAINAAVGSGSLLTYPALLATGLPPVVANGTNSLGVVPGAISGAWAYRDRLSTLWGELRPRAVAAGLGGLVGAGLVVILPARVFAVVVPWLILGACVLVAVQPLLMRRREHIPRSSRFALPIMGLVGVYGGYFGAGQGIAQLAALSAVDGDDIQRANAQKNVLSAAANLAATVVFVVCGYVMWLAALIICVAAFVGGFVGGGVARRLPPWALRSLILVVGLYAVVASFRALHV